VICRGAGYVAMAAGTLYRVMKAGQSGSGKASWFELEDAIRPGIGAAGEGAP